MKRSPIYPNCETNYYGGNEFDPHLDFSLFLEEAREHAREVNPQAPLSNPEKAGKGRLGEEKKNKKSWSSSLFKWWKVEKKSKPGAEPSNGSQVPNARSGNVSGPINGNARGFNRRHCRQNSGPVNSLFNPTKRGENEIPYMCLHQRSNSHASVAYGPVYLVT
ncbi:uncharacterized protein LOC119984687 [Tripterygium wilfordii]|nr:uncharacterized protein LOC119984687 [Tripterygium wilfordii]